MLMYGFSKRTSLTILAFSIMTMLVGCSDDATPADEVVCSTGERLNPITNLCEPTRSEDPFLDADVDPSSDTDDQSDVENSDVENDDVSLSDTAQDSGPNDIGNPEVTCYDIAAGQIDPDVDCSFYAHTDSTLYRVDPFRKTLQEVLQLPTNTFDIDMHTNGILYALAGNTLFSLSPDSESWNEEGQLEAGNPNGLCLDMGGRAFITSYSNLYSFDLDNRQLSSPIGGTDTLKPYSSSGDCVINKGDTLYMSSSSILYDDLIQIDSQTGATTKIGNIGFARVYALTAAWGKLYGLNDSGALIEISSVDGRGTLIHTFPGKSWFGAASTAQR